MQDYKARRSIRRPLRRLRNPLRFASSRSAPFARPNTSLRSRLLSASRFLTARRFGLLPRRPNPLPKGFRPLTPPPQPPVSAPGLVSAAAPIQRWFTRLPLLAIGYGAVLAWLLVGVGMRGLDVWRAPLERVRVSGTTTISSTQVVLMAGLAAGMRLSAIDPYCIALRLRQDPRVEAADARRVFPNTVWIDVRERTPDARVVLADGRAAVVDRYNAIIRVEAAATGELPLLRGIPEAAPPGSATPGAILGGLSGSPALTEARIFLSQAKEAGLPQFARSVLDLSDVGTVAVTPSAPAIRPGTRLLFPVSGADSALRLYRTMAASPVGSALTAAREADLRFVAAADGGRVFLRP